MPRAWAALAYTVFDSGGHRYARLFRLHSNQLINLNPETFSNVGTGIGNVSIARGTVIENAIGGIWQRSDHWQFGQQRDHRRLGYRQLTGGVGNDTFQDTLAGLNGDTITDFSAGDKIVITNASLVGIHVQRERHDADYKRQHTLDLAPPRAVL